MAKDHSHKSAVEPTGGGTLEVVDVERKPSYPVAPLNTSMSNLIRSTR